MARKKSKRILEEAKRLDMSRRLFKLVTKKDFLVEAWESAQQEDFEKIQAVLKQASEWIIATEKSEFEIEKKEWFLDFEKLAYKAVREQNVRALKALSMAGVCLEAPVYQRTLLAHAASEGKMESLKALVELGAKINEGAGESALGDLYPGMGMENLRGKGETALIAAAHAGMEEAVVWLIENGADIGKADIRKLTPLHSAVTMNRMEIARILVLEGAKASAVDLNGWTPLMKLSNKGWSTGVAALIIEASRREGCIDACNKQGLTAAHLSCRASDPKLLRMLMVAGVDVDKKDAAGFTAMQRSRATKWEPSWYAEYEKMSMEVMFTASGEIDASNECKRLSMRI